MQTPEQSQLGKATAYPDQYAPQTLFPIARQPQRSELGMTAGTALPFTGADLWTGYELSWLNPRGKPQVALVQVAVPCETPCIVESKSFKLYLNSFSNSRFASADEVRQRIAEDVGAAVWQPVASVSQQASGGAPPSTVGVRLVLPEQFAAQSVQELEGLSLDRLDVECSDYQPAPHWLRADTAESAVTETLTSHLLRSNCPVTQQPDWGDIQISYSGAPIDQEGLLRYIVSLRNHNGFHEHCVERIFMDILRHCRPSRLTVYARYTRRGGLDINPLRTNHPGPLPPNVRTARQ
ncbi:MAG: NADPH-dependent 7-cyano-7-deazaguanine reductase QueF [Brachymonas sp.]|nr:NADPH-dependent 7-cyano-7-deazaguanine reductase QueF [Brachymonas sp.]MBP9651686.1 NADPH-dependent 7-cyano-7-deazaguanine reductase QueF [Brachymonas sp.]